VSESLTALTAERDIARNLIRKSTWASTVKKDTDLGEAFGSLRDLEYL